MREDHLYRAFEWWSGSRSPWLPFLIIFFGLVIGGWDAFADLGRFDRLASILGYTLAALTLVIELANLMAKHLARAVSESACRELESHWQAEVAAGFGREWSLLMYLTDTAPPNERPLGRLLRQLHVRGAGSHRTRYVMARCLHAFGRATFGALEFAMDKDSYKGTLKDIMEGKLFERIYWTCPFSPVYHSVGEHTGGDPAPWAAFCTYEGAALRIVYLPTNLYNTLLLEDKLSIISTELVAKVTTSPAWLMIDNQDGTCIIDVREALRRFLSKFQGTKLWFSHPGMLEVGENRADQATQLKEIGKRSELGQALRGDYGLYEVQGTRIGISWDPGEKRAQILLDVDDNDARWKPFAYLQKAVELGLCDRLFATPSDLIKEAENKGGRKFKNDLSALDGREAPYVVPKDQVGVVVDHLLNGVTKWP
ncbi:MAG: hypothetical protein AB1714_00690 [Acidobacteriota bacterium]